MIFIRDIKKKEKVKCIQADLTNFKELGIILKKDFAVKDILGEDSKVEFEKKTKDVEDKSKMYFWEYQYNFKKPTT